MIQAASDGGADHGGPFPVIAQFRAWLGEELGLAFTDYEAMHRWSVANQDAFWGALWRFEGIVTPTPFSAVLSDARMPGATWFAGAQLNYARHVFSHVEPADAAGQPAIIAEDERGEVIETDWPTLRRRTASLALALRARGVGRGDRVAAYLPNRTEAVIAFLACASIGAIWSVCAPDMGARAVLARFQQIEPCVLIACEATYYTGRLVDRRALIEELLQQLPSVKTCIVVGSGEMPATEPNRGHVSFAELASRDDADTRVFQPDWVRFDQPLWIVYSSGTTGKPKALVHSHGGVLLGALATRLHMDLQPSYVPAALGERFHWYSSTGWIMWNSQVAGLLSGTTICLFDGSAAGTKEQPDWSRLWRFAARHRITFFGAGAAYYTQCVKMRVDVAAVGDLGRLRALGSTGSPLPAEVQQHLSRALVGSGYADPWWLNISGGTDICGAFCTGNRELPATPGKLQCRQLGAAVEAWDANGRPLVGEIGELVCVKPLPSMPLFLWGDDNGERYRETYFGVYDGVWRHGDWLLIDERGTCEIFGRSDATINRGGHRLGTSEIYDVVESHPGVLDSMMIDVRIESGRSALLLFLVTSDPLSQTVVNEVNQAIRTELSPRFVPDDIIAATGIPRTLSMKKQEIPVKKIFEGSEPSSELDPATMYNPELIQEFADLRQMYLMRMGRA
ncbi:acetoacetate--CoA ligase [Sphingomonas sp. CL5.1]|uniref:acetoacetate--CoA ligase n=1 Tax=Sphingomonas sp. CL5.1 TaxID=2653203 RepID=UPI001582001A|nr:acetoacetate--CoA ligase [Sphingomonas sp. CL5.1]QKR99270.1 acetoacetate--CoA ligase [Sphingomonas sp. CL5.1]